MPFLEWEVISYACPKHTHIYVSAQWGTGTVLWTNGDVLSIGTSGTTCTNIFIPQNILNNAVCKMFAILFRPQQLVECLNTRFKESRACLAFTKFPPEYLELLQLSPDLFRSATSGNKKPPCSPKYLGPCRGWNIVNHYHIDSRHQVILGAALQKNENQKGCPTRSEISAVSIEMGDTKAPILTPTPPHHPPTHTTTTTTRAAYMRKWIGSALVQIMACRLFGARPLSKLCVKRCPFSHSFIFECDSLAAFSQLIRIKSVWQASRLPR